MRVLNKVEGLLRDDQQVRDSDKKLLAAYWETQGLHLTPHQYEIFMRCTAAESITRARRHLKERYPASEEVNEYRFNKFKDYRDAHVVSWLKEE